MPCSSHVHVDGGSGKMVLLKVPCAKIEPQMAKAPVSVEAPVAVAGM